MVYHTLQNKMESQTNATDSKQNESQDKGQTSFTGVEGLASLAGGAPLDVDNYIEEPHIIIDSCFRGRHLKRLVEHQIESFNDFIQYQVPRTISMFNPVHVCSEDDFVKEVGKYRLEMFITFEKFSIYRPQIHENNGATKIMFPQEARLRNFTYASAMTIDINIKYIVRTGETLQHIRRHS